VTAFLLSEIWRCEGKLDKVYDVAHASKEKIVMIWIAIMILMSDGLCRFDRLNWRLGGRKGARVVDNF